MQKRKQIRKLIKGVAVFPLAAVLCCGTIVYGVSGNGLRENATTGISDNGTEYGNGTNYENGTDNTVSGQTLEEDHWGGYPEETEEEKEMKKLSSEITVVIDPGHGGEDEGCSVGGVLEKDVNLEIAKSVRDKLREMGYQVVMTREGDQFSSTEERVRRANLEKGDLYVSIHQNACETSEPNGVEAWYCQNENGEKSRRLARLMEKYVVQFTGAQEREISETDSLYVLRETDMPSCLVETGFLTNAAERAKLTDPEYQDAIAEGIAYGVDFYFFPKTMYLTFDDGPSEESTNAILDVLKERNIKATFFVVGENVEKHPETARRIVEEGHTIGIHCYRHDYDEIYASADGYIEDFERACRVVYETTGAEVKLFRFPGGSVNHYNRAVYEEIIERMTAKGFIYFDWNASLEDAVTPSPEPQTLIENAMESTLKRKKVVMLGHDIVYSTALCLDDLIDAFPEYRMEPLTADVEPIQF